MADVGSLTTSGLLSEGIESFETWVKRVDALIDLHRLCSPENEKSRVLYTLYACGELHSHLDDSDYQQIISLVRWQVSPSLIYRVPTAAMTDLRDFLDALYRHSRPFDLTSLPPEIRRRIIKYMFENISLPVTSYDMSRESPRLVLPKLTQVNREFCKEVRTLFLTKTYIVLTLSHAWEAHIRSQTGLDSSTTRAQKAIHELAASIGTANL